MAAARDQCPGCAGSGYRSDELQRAGEDLTDEEIEMLDTTRCHTCFGDGTLPIKEILDDGTIVFDLPY